MARAYEDLRGKRVNFLMAVEYVGDSSWLWLCDCGNKIVARSGNVKSGNTKSCGCVKRQKKGEAPGKPPRTITAEEREQLMAVVGVDPVWLRLRWDGKTVASLAQLANMSPVDMLKHLITTHRRPGS